MGRLDAIRAIAPAAVLAVALTLPGAASTRAAGLVVHPGESIQAAVDAARPGDTVVVLPGTYHEAVCVTTDGIDLRGRGAVIQPPPEPAATPCAVIPAGIFLLGQLDVATGIVSDPISDVTVSGFRVEGFEASGILMFGGRDVDIVGNTAADNEEYGIARFFSTGGTLRANRVKGLSRPDSISATRPTPTRRSRATRPGTTACSGSSSATRRMGRSSAIRRPEIASGSSCSRPTGRPSFGRSRATAPSTTRGPVAAATSCRRRAWASPWPVRATRS